MPNPKRSVTDVLNPNFESGLDILNEEDSPEGSEDLKKYFDLEDDDAEDADPAEESEEKDDDTPVFDGFDSNETDKPSNEDASDPILEEMRGMTPEKFTELVKSDPAKAMEMTVTAVLQKRGITGFDPREVMEATRTYVGVQDTRKAIAEQFKPAKNTKLRERAQQIYKERGFDVRKNPMAEFDAFVIASHESPELLSGEDEVVRNEPTRSTRRSRQQAPDTRLTKADVEIARRMNIPLNDPKSVKRLVALKADYERRRR